MPSRTRVIPLVLVLLASCAAGPQSPVQHEPGAGAPLPSEEVPGADQRRPELRPQVPDFVLPSATGDVFALGEQRGRWVVLHLYPRADTPDCACDATVFTEHLWRFGGLDASIACITGETEERARRFAKKYGLSIPLLSDPDCTVVRLLGAFDDRSADPIVRTTMIVDPEGRAAARWDGVTDPAHVEEILERLALLQGVSGQ